MSEAGWGILFVLGIGAMVTIVLTTLIYQWLEIVKIRVRRDVAASTDREAFNELPGGVGGQQSQ